MAATLLNVQYVTREGTPITYTTCNSTDDAEFYNDGNCIVLLRHATSGVTLEVQFPLRQRYEGRNYSELGVQVAPVATLANNAGVHKMVGPFPPRIYNDMYGKVKINLAANGGVETSWHIAVVSYI